MKVVGLGLVLVCGVHKGDVEGADLVAGEGARVRSILGHGNLVGIAARGRRETAHNDLVAHGN